MAAKKSKKSAKPSARKLAQRGAPKLAQRGAPKPANTPPRAAAKAARTASQSDSSGVVYSDLRRDALAWQLKKLR